MKKTFVTTAAIAALALTLSGCGGSDDSTDTNAAQQSGQQTGGGWGGSPGGSGKVVEVDGTTAQVQSQSGQVAVTWSDDTTFSQQVSGSLDDVTVGSCVMVQPADANSDADSTDAITAGTVRIVAAQDGECSMGSGSGGGGPRPDGAPQDGERPEGAPTDMPDGRTPPTGGGRGGFGTVGEVTDVTASGFVVEAAQMADSDRDDDESTSVTVTVDADTSYTTTAEATAADVTVGVCITSRGKADDTGAIAATTISVSDAVDGECTSGFGMGGPGGRQGDDS